MVGVRLFAALSVVAAMAACAPTLPNNTPVQEVRWLDQNWSADERYWFHHATQGTATLPVPYKWFVALEQPRLWLAGVPSWAKPRTSMDNTMVKALARAFRWRRLLETGVYATVEEIAAAEKINASYVSRILRLTLLAPDIVEMILDGRQHADLTMAALTKPFPVEWEEQRRLLELDRLSGARLDT